ncbi:MAG: hypothetical protein EOP61_09635 [Sphingomonadales bacterium]|nr:MAG: hypothetical protein EOP61_09635 [Sphingomonadales bacterium]
MRSNHCPKCQGSMIQGFVIEQSQGYPAVDTWISGAPEKGWFGAKTKGRKKLEVQTWRCTRCGFLESYAPE